MSSDFPNRERKNRSDSNADSAACGVSRVIRAIQESSSPKLASINVLLQTVVQLAQTVVKGTDSQQRFNAQFSEFCRTALVGIPDLEVAVHALEKTEELGERNGHDEQDVKGIRVTDFVKEIANFIALQTSTLGAQYLEHVGMSALTKASMVHTASAAKKRSVKRGRVDDAKERNFDRKSPVLRRVGTSPPVAYAVGSDTPLPKVGHTAGGATGGHNAILKLSNNSELSTWLHPWTLPLPSVHGVAIDRVTTERARPLPVLEEFSKPPGEVLIFDLCIASTTAEVIRLWEARECLLSTSEDRPSGSSPVLTGAVYSSAVKEDCPVFFPRRTLGTRSSVPMQVMADLVHYGISSLEMPFKDMV